MDKVFIHPYIYPAIPIYDKNRHLNIKNLNESDIINGVSKYFSIPVKTLLETKKNKFERSHLMFFLTEIGKTQKEISKIVNLDRSAVSNALTTFKYRDTDKSKAELILLFNKDKERQG